MKMQELERRTGVGREAIRGYLRHGLIPAPERPKKTVAVYNERHVKAILAVRGLLKGSRLTLTQIASIIGGDVNEQRVVSDAFVHLEQLVTARIGLDESVVPLSQLAVRYKYAQIDVIALADAGILSIVQDSIGADAVTITDAELVAIWGEMRVAGFDERLDFVPTMLSFYVDAAKFVGSREAATFLERVSGRVDEVSAAVMVQQALPLMLNFFGILRQREFMTNVRAGQPAASPPSLAPGTLLPTPIPSSAQP